MEKHGNVFNLKNKDFPQVFLGDGYENAQIRSATIQIHDIAITTPLLKLPTPLHRPEYNYFVFIAHGNAVQRIENKIVEITANQVLYIRHGTVTSVLSISPDVKGYVITIEDDVMAKIVTKRNYISISAISSVINFHTSKAEWLNKLLELLLSELSASSMQANHVAIALLEAFLQKILAETTDQTLDRGLKRAAELLFEFKDLVNKNFAIEKTVTAYANALNVTPNYLNRCVRERMNMTAKDWINQIVVLNSQIELQTTSKDISEIAYQLNFEDPSYFGRLFKKVTGMTPSDYRERHLHDLSE